MLEPEPGIVGHHQELPETGHGFRDLGVKRPPFLLNLEMGFSGQSAIEDSLNWVIVNLEDVREFENESPSFVLFESEATSEEIETRDGDGLVALGENEGPNLEDLSGLLLDLHVVVETMVSDPLQVLGNGGRFGHGSCGSEIIEEESDGSEEFIFWFEELS